MPKSPDRPRPEPWSEFRRAIPHRWLAPYYWLEWVWEWIAHALGNWVFLEVLQYLGRFTVLVAVIFYFAERPDRQKQKHYQAWQVINTAQGKGGSGGRIDALQELNRDGVALVGVNAAGGFLMGIHLEKANLLRSDFSGADLRDCRLRSANLAYSDLSSANLRFSDLRGVHFERAALDDADLAGADLSECDLTAAKLTKADLRWSDLRSVSWKDIAGIKLANLFGVKNAPAGFLEWALKQGAVSIESDRQWTKLVSASERE